MKTLVALLGLLLMSCVTPDAKPLGLGAERIRFDSVLRRQETTLVAFWATWCEACKKELSALVRDDQWPTVFARPSFHLILMSVDESEEEARGWVKRELGEPYSNCLQFDKDGALADSYQLESIPQTLLFTQDREVYRTGVFTPAEVIHEIQIWLP